MKHIRENTHVKKARGNEPQECLVNHSCITYHARDTKYVTTEILLELQSLMINSELILRIINIK